MSKVKKMGIKKKKRKIKNRNRVVSNATIFLGSALFFLTLGSLLTFWFNQKYECPNTKQTEEISQGKAIPLDQMFFERQLFDMAIAETSGEIFKKGKIRGGVIPHHLLASFMIADFFEKLSLQGDVKTVVFVGPNHFGKEQENIYSSGMNWDVPNGTVEVERRFADELRDKKIAKDGSELFGKEHSMGGMMPFMKRYLPSAKVVPIVVGYQVDEELRGEMTQLIADWASDEKVVVVGSIDFSHYLSSSEAEERDVETKNAIQEKGVKKILSFKDDHLDSPKALVTIMEIMEKIGMKNSEILDNTNSGKLLGRQFDETTSYFEIVWF